MNLYKICERKLKYLNYSKRTSEIYLRYIDEFLSSHLLKINQILDDDKFGDE